MTLPQRSLLDKEVSNVRNNILAMTSMVEEAIENAMQALNDRDIELALQVEAADADVNALRYAVEKKPVCILATQFPAASDLRRVILQFISPSSWNASAIIKAAGIAPPGDASGKRQPPPEESFYDLPKWRGGRAKWCGSALIPISLRNAMRLKIWCAAMLNSTRTTRSRCAKCWQVWKRMYRLNAVFICCDRA